MTTRIQGADPTPFKEQAEPTMNINFFSTVALTERLLPLVKRSDAGRIVNVCSQSGHLKIIPEGKLREKFASAGAPGGLGKDELMTLAHKFVEDVKAGTHTDAGWPNTCYGMR
jgi:NAD(P)-dependent dehydrogenase (short-subunit alcohol dehydrogenase family)